MKSRYVVGILFLAVAVLYLPFLGNVFISDDIGGLVAAAPGWTWITSVGWPYTIHLNNLFQFGLFHLFGMTPWPFHLLPILFHAGSVALVYLIVKKLRNTRIGFIAALLFAVHPLATESVVWISGGNYAQAAFFLFLSFWLYIQEFSIINFQFSILFFLLCLLTSEKTIALSLIFVSYEWFDGHINKNWRRLLSFVCLSLLIVAFYVLKIGERTTSLGVTGIYNPLIQLPAAISSYLALFFWPIHLTLYHSNLTFIWWNYSIRAVVTVAYGVVLVYTLFKRKKIGFWFWWPLIVLAPTLTPLKIAWVVAERYIYGGLIGWCVIVAMLFDRILSKKNQQVLWLCVGMFLVLLLSIRTVIRNTEWVSADSLWTATLRESPEDPHSWNNMGDVYARRGELEQSVNAFTQATKLDPNYADAYHNIGNTYLQMQQYDKAIPFFEKAVSLNPNLWQSYQDLAGIAVEKGNYPQALGYIEKALNIDPANPTLQKNEKDLQRLISGK